MVNKRTFFEIGDDWKNYINQQPIILAKQLSSGTVIEDGKQTIICDKGDYIVSINGDIHKFKKDSFLISLMFTPSISISPLSTS